MMAFPIELIFSSFRAEHPCVVPSPPVGTGGYSNMALSEPAISEVFASAIKKAPDVVVRGSHEKNGKIAFGQ